MQQRSARFDATIAGSHTNVTSCDVLSNGVVIAEGLPVSQGSITASRGQFVRRTCDISIAGSTFVPTGSTSDLLSTYGNEIRLWRGVRYPDGSEELLPQGTFGIQDIEINDPAMSIEVIGMDRCQRLSEARFVSSRTVLAGSSLIGTIGSWISEVVPFASFVVMPGVVDIPLQQATYNQDRDQSIVNLAAVVGAELYCDPWGGFLLAPIPDPNSPSVFTVRAGPGGILVAAARKSSRAGTYNGIVATGVGVGASVAPTAFVYDDDPTSPTYWFGPFGQLPAFLNSSQLTNTNQCLIAGHGSLRNSLGAARSVDFTAVPNVALEPGDIVEFEFSDGSSEIHLLDNMSFGLTAADALTASTRATAAPLGLS